VLCEPLTVVVDRELSKETKSLLRKALESLHLVHFKSSFDPTGI
jgi:hypothetical protein